MNNLSGIQTFRATKKKMVLKNFQTSNLSGIQFLYNRFPSSSTVGFRLKPRVQGAGVAGPWGGGGGWYGFFFFEKHVFKTRFSEETSVWTSEKKQIFLFFSHWYQRCVFFPRYVWGAGFPDRTLWWPGAGRGNPGGPRQVVSCWMDGFFHTTSWGWFIPLLVRVRDIYIPGGWPWDFWTIKPCPRSMVQRSSNPWERRVKVVSFWKVWRAFEEVERGEQREVFDKDSASFCKNHGSGKWRFWRLNSSSPALFSTSMIMGERKRFLLPLGNNKFSVGGDTSWPTV